MVAFLTFGLITPTHEIWEAFDHNPSNRASIGPEPRTSTAVAAEHDDYQDEQIQIQEEEIDYNALLLDAAREQSYIKFGTKVGPVIEQQFETDIFPKIEEAISLTVDRLGVESLSNLSISEKPSGEYSEKIFHIVNNDSNKDVIRFHVRTENRPFEGYYYNFHYHTFEDNYQTHYNLGDIYWSKNTPPKWLS